MHLTARLSGCMLIVISRIDIYAPDRSPQWMHGLYQTPVLVWLIFADEIDSLLGRRDSQYEHEGMRKIKNEFMSMWDGLTTKTNERVIVLAATNRPFDLDDAVLRRLPRVCRVYPAVLLWMGV